jgi:hypothetical protein
MMILPVLFLLDFATRCLGQTVQDEWLHPVLYENIINGSKYDIIWSPDLVPLFADYCTKCDTFNVDLCVQPSSNRNVNITIGRRSGRPDPVIDRSLTTLQKASMSPKRVSTPGASIFLLRTSSSPTGSCVSSLLTVIATMRSSRYRRIHST